MNKFRGKGVKGAKKTEFYRSGGPLWNFQMKSGGLGPGEILQRGRRRIVKKMGALIKKWGGGRKKGVASEEKSPRSG